jgi:hypothetical protein
MLLALKIFIFSKRIFKKTSQVENKLERKRQFVASLRIYEYKKTIELKISSKIK